MAFIPTQYNNPIFVYSLRKLVTDYFDPLVRVIRESDFVEVDVLPDSNDEVSYDSVIVRGSDTLATTLGEFLNISGYTDADSLGSVYEGRLTKVYDQSAGTFDIDIAVYGDAFLFVETNLAEYNGSTAIHKVNGIPTFRPQALTTAFQVANVREREVSYHFLVEGTQSGFFGIVDSSNTLAIQGLHNYTLERTYTSFISPSTPSDWDVNDVYFDSVVSTNITGSLYESNTWNNFDTAIITVEAAIKDNAVTQSAFPDNIATFRLVQNNWYCDLIAFDDYDPIRRLTIEGLYADASSNASAFSRTSKLLLNVEDPTQSGFLAQYPNAAAAYSVRSLTGNTGTDGPKIVRVRRDSDNVEVDVYTDNSGWVSLDSPVVIVPAITGQIDGGTGVEIDSLASTLGEFVADADHEDVDFLGSPTTAKVVVWYDQSSADYTIISEEIDARGAPVRIRVVGGTYDAYEFDLYFDDNESISLSSYVADTYEISDGATQVTANLTLGTLQTLVDAGMTEATVCVWYDQSGNANDATQTTASQQPKIYDSSTGVTTKNNKPAASFDNTDFMPSAYNFGSNFSAYAVASSEDLGNNTNLVFSEYGTAPNTLLAYIPRTTSGLTVSLGYAGTFAIGTGTPDTNQHAFVYRKNGTTISVRFDATAAANATTSATFVNSTFALSGAVWALGGSGAKTISEVVIYDDGATNDSGIEGNINTYYDIYGTGNTGVNTPLLDTYSGAAAAYSLRKLRTSYNGPVNLSKRKDAIQNVATAQPTIYNGGLITENSRGAIYFNTTSKLASTNVSSFDNTDEFSAFTVLSPKSLTSFGFYYSLTDENGGDIVLNYSLTELLTFAAYIPLAGPRINYKPIDLSQYIFYTQAGASARLDINEEIHTGTVDISAFSKATILEINNKENLEGDANYQELIFWADTKQDDVNDIKNNINSAFQIYAANFSSVLDSVPLAKAAYSIRRLTKNYIDPIITVTNGSTTKDFYADFWGNLDVDALTSFANGGTLSVTKWWDQSGEGVHLLTTSTRPTLTIANNEVSVNTTNKFYEPLLDRYEDAAAAYSLRILKGDYTGPLVRVRRDGTNTEVDVYPDENLTISLNSPVLNVAEATTDVTASPADTLATTLGEFVADAGNDPDGLGATVSAFVVVWYDQANSNNASQDISTSQPKIYDSVAGVVTENGKPALDFAAISHFDLVNYINPTANTTYTLSGVARPDVNDNLMVNLTDGTELMSWAYGRTAGNLTARTFDGATVSDTSGAIAINTQFLGFSIHDFTSVFTSLYINGGAATGTNAGRGDLAQSTIGDGPISSLQFDGAWQEIVLWNSGQSANRTEIEGNINNHYQIPNFNATASTAQTVAVYNNAINTTVDLNATYTDLKEIIKYE